MKSADESKNASPFNKFCNDHRTLLFSCFIIVFPLLIAGIIFLASAGLSGRLKIFRSDSPDMFDDSAVHTVTFLDVNGDVYKTYEVRHGACIGESPVYSEEGYVFVKWDVPCYCNLDISEYPVGEDMVIKPELIEERLVALNVLAVAGPDMTDEERADLGEFAEQIRREALNESEK